MNTHLVRSSADPFRQIGQRKAFSAEITLSLFLMYEPVYSGIRQRESPYYRASLIPSPYARDAASSSKVPRAPIAFLAAAGKRLLLCIHYFPIGTAWQEQTNRFILARDLPRKGRWLGGWDTKPANKYDLLSKERELTLFGPHQQSPWALFLGSQVFIYLFFSCVPHRYVDSSSGDKRSPA